MPAKKSGYIMYKKCSLLKVEKISKKKKIFSAVNVSIWNFLAYSWVLLRSLLEAH